MGKIKNDTEHATYNLSETKAEMLQDAKKAGIMYDGELDPDIRSLRQTIVYGLKGIAAYGHQARERGYFDDEVDNFYVRALEATTDDNLSLEDLIRWTMRTGEMIPCHGYPQLKKYDHLVGNFGGAWQDQQKEFDNIPGCVLMTTNCLMKPRESYKDRIFTTSVVGWDGVKYIGVGADGKKDFTPIIEKALELGGYEEDQEPHEILVGFGHHATLSYAEDIVNAVKDGKIRYFFLIGGCDGARPGRNYYTEFTKKVPDDCVILTLACGKYRFNKLDFGEVAGLPRLLYVGQCNDAYSAVKIATSLADAFDTDVNGLPLSLIISWYEQKAVADLLALLSLGIKGIYLGPTLSAFLSPNVLQYLVDTFDLRSISTPDDDLKTCLQQGI